MVLNLEYLGSLEFEEKMILQVKILIEGQDRLAQFLAQWCGKYSVEKSLLDQTLTKQITGVVDMASIYSSTGFTKFTSCSQR